MRRAPKIRRDNSADIEDLKLDAGFMDAASPDAYERTASTGYLGSHTIVSARKKRKRRKVVATVCLSAAVLVLVLAGVALAYFGGIGNKLTSGLDSSIFSELTPVDSPEDPFYVLLLGTDRSDEREADEYYGDSFRSDSMMLARIDPKNTKASIVSIPRDLQVDLGKYGEDKINAAHYFGGPTLAVKTVSKLAGVPISHYAEIDLNGFAEVVDALGGIEVDVPIEIDDDEAGGYLEPGLQTLDGHGALILCRSRHAYDDYGAGDLYRAANQRVVLSAIAQKLLASDPITIASSLDSLAGSVITDMDVASIIAIAQNMRGLDSQKDIFTGVVPTNSEYIGDIWYEILDESAWKAMMRRVEAGLSPTEDDLIDDETGTVLSYTGSGASASSGYSINRTQRINIRNGNGTAGLSADVEAALGEMGYRNIDSGNADNFDYDETLIIYKDEANEKYADQISEVLGRGTPMMDDGEYLFDSDYLIIIGADWTL